MHWQLFFLVMRSSKLYTFSNFQIWNTELLSIVTMLFGKSSLFIYFTTVKFVPFMPFIHFTPPPLPSLPIPISILCLWSFLKFKILCTSQITYSMSFSVWLILLGILQVHPHYCKLCFSFFGWIILHIYNFIYTKFSLSINKHLDFFHMLAIVNMLQ